VPHSSDEEDEAAADEEVEEEDSDIERQLWGRSRRRRRRGGKRRRGGARRKRSVVATKVPPELASVLGEANMLYVAHQYDEAILLLKDFIKKAPTIPDPYHTLGMIYEDRQDRTKALQFFLIACTLTPQDAELWKRVGRIAKDENNLDQALFCFKKASSADPKDKEALFSYAELCREQGDNRRAAEVFRKLTVLIPNDLSLWMQIAEAYHCNEQEDEAVDALKTCIEKAAGIEPAMRHHSSKYELNAVNMLADLYITLKKYRNAINVIHDLDARNAAAQEAGLMEGDAWGLPLDIAVKMAFATCLSATLRRRNPCSATCSLRMSRCLETSTLMSPTHTSRLVVRTNVQQRSYTTCWDVRSSLWSRSGSSMPSATIVLGCSMSRSSSTRRHFCTSLTRPV